MLWAQYAQYLGAALWSLGGMLLYLGFMLYAFGTWRLLPDRHTRRSREEVCLRLNEQYAHGSTAALAQLVLLAKRRRAAYAALLATPLLTMFLGATAYGFGLILKQWGRAATPPSLGANVLTLVLASSLFALTLSFLFVARWVDERSLPELHLITAAGRLLHDCDRAKDHKNRSALWEDSLQKQCLAGLEQVARRLEDLRDRVIRTYDDHTQAEVNSLLMPLANATRAFKQGVLVGSSQTYTDVGAFLRELLLAVAQQDLGSMPHLGADVRQEQAATTAPGKHTRAVVAICLGVLVLTSLTVGFSLLNQAEVSAAYATGVASIVVAVTAVWINKLSRAILDGKSVGKDDEDHRGRRSRLPKQHGDFPA